METTHGRVDVKVGDIPPRCCCRGDGEAGCRAGREAAAAKALPAGGRAGPRARAMQQAPPLAKVSGRPPVSAAVQGVSARPCRRPPPLASAGALQQSRAGHEAVRSVPFPFSRPLPPSTHRPPPPAPGANGGSSSLSCRSRAPPGSPCGTGRRQPPCLRVLACCCLSCRRPAGLPPSPSPSPTPTRSQERKPGGGGGGGGPL